MTKVYPKVSQDEMLRLSVGPEMMNEKVLKAFPVRRSLDITAVGDKLGDVVSHTAIVLTTKRGPLLVEYMGDSHVYLTYSNDFKEGEFVFKQRKYIFMLDSIDGQEPVENNLFDNYADFESKYYSTNTNQVDTETGLPATSVSTFDVSTMEPGKEDEPAPPKKEPKQHHHKKHHPKKEKTDVTVREFAEKMCDLMGDKAYNLFHHNCHDARIATMEYFGMKTKNLYSSKHSSIVATFFRDIHRRYPNLLEQYNLEDSD